MSNYLVRETKEELKKDIEKLEKDISALKAMYSSLYVTCQGIIKENKDLAQLILERVTELKAYGR
jgi:prefoldin subunit 5